MVMNHFFSPRQIGQRMVRQWPSCRWTSWTRQWCHATTTLFKEAEMCAKHLLKANALRMKTSSSRCILVPFQYPSRWRCWNTCSSETSKHRAIGLVTVTSWEQWNVKTPAELGEQLFKNLSSQEQQFLHALIWFWLLTGVFLGCLYVYLKFLMCFGHFRRVAGVADSTWPQLTKFSTL